VVHQWGPAAASQEAIMPIPNSDFAPRESFPGVATGADTTGAPGTAGASGRAADSAGATVTPPWGGHQDRYPASAGTLQPDQDTPSVITGGDGGYHDTGAGSGRAGHYPRKSWQQPNGGT
jgi:hypothetical protein